MWQIAQKNKPKPWTLTLYLGVDVFLERLGREPPHRPRVLSCGPQPSFRALSGRLKFTVRRDKSNNDSFAATICTYLQSWTLNTKPCTPNLNRGTPPEGVEPRAPWGMSGGGKETGKKERCKDRDVKIDRFNDIERERECARERRTFWPVVHNHPLAMWCEL